MMIRLSPLLRIPRRQCVSAAVTATTSKSHVSVTLHQPPKAPVDAYAPSSSSLLSVAQAAAINLGPTCDGDLTCTACACSISPPEHQNTSLSQLSPPSAEEVALLSAIPGADSTFRLSCQLTAAQAAGNVVSFPHFEASPSNLEHGPIEPLAFRSYTKSHIPSLIREHAPNNTQLLTSIPLFQLVATVLPFRTNNYVTTHLIDWEAVPHDPMFRLNFPSIDMLPQTPVLDRLRSLLGSNAPAAQVAEAAHEMRETLNPHPASQATMNVPVADASSGNSVQGLQHKYSQTVLFFPADAQYCHAYCTYCFRWPQFVGGRADRFGSRDIDMLTNYLAAHPWVTDVLITGGDPLVLSAQKLRGYLEPLCSDPRLGHVRSIRIGSKALAYWPYKFVTDADADAVCGVLRDAVASGKHIALMAHFTHPVELRTAVAREAIRRIRETGVVIRCQGPLVRGINDDPLTLAELWQTQVELGLVPYYLFVERDTGAKSAFAIPLARAWQTFQDATESVSGLAKTVRGPSMSCTAGKVCVIGVTEVHGEKVFVLKMLQGRRAHWSRRVFFAKYCERATWMDELEPAFGEEKFFFEDELDELERTAEQGQGSSGQLVEN